MIIERHNLEIAALIEDQMRFLPTQDDVMHAVKIQIESSQFSPEYFFMHYHDYLNSNLLKRLPRKTKKKLKQLGILK